VDPGEPGVGYVYAGKGGAVRSESVSAFLI